MNDLDVMLELFDLRSRLDESSIRQLAAIYNRRTRFTQEEFFRLLKARLRRSLRQNEVDWKMEGF